MNKRMAMMLAVALPGSAYAETYDFEVGATYSRSQSESSSSVFGSSERLRVDNDTDAIGLSATWFADGLGIDGQLRSEAPFMTRTSSISVGYSRTSGDATSSGPFGSAFDNSFDADTLSASGRYVWANSGWFFDGGAGRVDVDGQASTTLTLGFGRYIAQNTTIGLSLGRTETDFGGGTSTSSGAILSGKHIGSLNEQWSYGVGATVSNISIGDAPGRYTAAFSLYPNQDLAFGISTAGPLGNRDNDVRSFGLRAGWFVQPALEITGSFQWSTFDDDDDIDQDADGLSLGFSYRF